MSLNNIKKMQSERGFTIVELLIVIVVIGILAAIVIVAYQGVTNKANASAAKGNAESVQKVAEAYNADKSTYPAAVADLSTTGLTAKMPSGVTVDGTLPTGTDNDKSGKHILYVPKSTTGGCIAFWDVSKASGSELTKLFVGDATALSGAAVCS